MEEGDITQPVCKLPYGFAPVAEQVPVPPEAGPAKRAVKRERVSEAPPELQSDDEGVGQMKPKAPARPPPPRTDGGTDRGVKLRREADESSSAADIIT